MTLSILDHRYSKVYQVDMTKIPNWNEDWESEHYETWIWEQLGHSTDCNWMIADIPKGVESILNPKALENADLTKIIETDNRAIHWADGTTTFTNSKGLVKTIKTIK